MRRDAVTTERSTRSTTTSGSSPWSPSSIAPTCTAAASGKSHIRDVPISCGPHEIIRDGSRRSRLVWTHPGCQASSSHESLRRRQRVAQLRTNSPGQPTSAARRPLPAFRRSEDMTRGLDTAGTKADAAGKRLSNLYTKECGSSADAQRLNRFEDHHRDDAPGRGLLVLGEARHLLLLLRPQPFALVTFGDACSHGLGVASHLDLRLEVGAQV